MDLEEELAVTQDRGTPSAVDLFLIGYLGTIIFMDRVAQPHLETIIN